jgi:hypothetical protein
MKTELDLTDHVVAEAVAMAVSRNQFEPLIAKGFKRKSILRLVNRHPDLMTDPFEYSVRLARQREERITAIRERQALRGNHVITEAETVARAEAISLQRETLAEKRRAIADRDLVIAKQTKEALQLRAQVVSLAVDIAKAEQVTTSSGYELLTICVCNVFMIDESDLLGKERKSLFSAARRAFSYFARHELRRTLKEIANALRCDHTSVMHAIKKASRCLRESPIDKARYDAVVEMWTRSIDEAGAIVAKKGESAA